MMDLHIILAISISFFVTLLIMPYWIRKMREIDLVWSDVNKLGARKVSGSGGLVVILGFIIGLLFYVAYRVFYFQEQDNFLIEIFATLVSILFLALIGFVDDLFGWRKGGLSKRSRIILVLMASIPLIAINAGKSSVFLPFIGLFDFGIFYPLFLIPLGIIATSTAFNFIAGFNGLEAGQGIILLSGLSLVAFFTGGSWLAVIGFCMVASLIGFLLFNFYPAKVFPGDALTYGVGGLVAIIAILGNFERVAIFFFIPYIFELGLKLRGNLRKYSFGKPLENGTLDLRYHKIYSLNHISIYLMKNLGIRSTEKKCVYLIWIFQLLTIIFGMIIFKSSIF